MVLEGLGGIDVEEYVIKSGYGNPVAPRELYGGHPGLEMVGLSVAGVAIQNVDVSHQTGWWVPSVCGVL